MAIGYPITKIGLDNTMGGLVVSLRDAFNDVVFFKGQLDNAAILPDSVLVNLGYTGSASTGEIKRIRDGFTLLSLLNTVSKGGSTVPSAVDFWADAQYLAGSNFHLL